MARRLTLFCPRWLASNCAHKRCSVWSLAPKGFPRSLASKGFPSGYSKSVCVRLHSENSEPTILISQTTPDEHPRRHRLADGQLSSFYPASPRFSSFGAASVMCCSAPACSSTPLRQSVHYPSMSCKYINSVYFNILWTSKCPLYFRPDRLVSFGSQAGALRRECSPHR